MDETRESKDYVNIMDSSEVRDRLNGVPIIRQAPQMQYQQQSHQLPPLISRKSKSIHQKQQRQLQQERLEIPSSLYNLSIWITWMWNTSLSILILANLPSYVSSSDYECGINRFNNESPLTERIVGGNNSLQ